MKTITRTLIDLAQTEICWDSWEAIEGAFPALLRWESCPVDVLVTALEWAVSQGLPDAKYGQEEILAAI